MAKLVLEFEKPIIELEQKIEEMRKYADNLDIADEISTLERRFISSASRSSPISLGGSVCSWHAIPTARIPSTTFT